MIAHVRFLDRPCEVGHDETCLFCPHCCPCVGYCAERAAVIREEAGL